MKFVLHRNHVLASAMGLAIEFKKGVPQYVPKHIHKEAIAIGAVPEEELAEAEVASNPNMPADIDARKIELYDAFEKIVLRNEREEFTAAGIPNTAVLSRELGWTVNAKERDIAWQEFLVGKTD